MLGIAVGTVRVPHEHRRLPNHYLDQIAQILDRAHDSRIVPGEAGRQTRLDTSRCGNFWRVDALIRRSRRFGPLLIDYDDAVLAPREWTFLQSEWAATLATTAPAGPILELCAGAGHIGLAAAVLADRDLVQVEADPVAASYATQNAERAGWSGHTEVRVERLQSAMRSDERFPIMIADPPYLCSADVKRWPEDPIAAIDGGVDGLDLIRACLEVAARCLEQGGHLLLQVRGPRQTERLGVLAGLRRRDLRVVDNDRAVLLLDRP